MSDFAALWPEDGFAEWLGHREEAEDTVTPGLLDRFGVTVPALATPVAGLHWCLAPVAEPAANLGPDGHPRLGLHLPPIPLARRMWAGGALTFHDNLQSGDTVRRISTIRDIVRKDGRSGPLVFMTVDHEVFTRRGPAVTERQDIVYRAPSGNLKPPRPQPTALRITQSREVATNPTLLFRYSALTFNGHRIHYDQPYATQVEGYAGLVVHGPLIATLLADLACAELGGLRKFEFRGISPLFAPETVTLLCARDGAGATLEARGPDGRLVMSAEAAA